MKGDAMGGPYVMRRIRLRKRGMKSSSLASSMRPK